MSVLLDCCSGAGAPRAGDCLLASSSSLAVCTSILYNLMRIRTILSNFLFFFIFPSAFIVVDSLGCVILDGFAAVIERMVFLVDFNYSNYLSNSALRTSAFASSPLNTNGFVSSPVNSGVTATGIYNPNGAAYSIYEPYISNPLLDMLYNQVNNNGNKPDVKPTTAPAAASTVADPQTIDYLYAELAKHYGMSAETAYQEALANTSYQRAMKDMQAAGLNPAVIFGSGKGSGADGVSYVSSGITGSGPSGGTTAKSNKKDNLFSEGAYYGLSAAIGLLVAGITKSPTGYWIGSQATQGALGALNAAYKSR